MKISILGTGTVGQTIAAKLISLGHEVMMGTKNAADKLASTNKDGITIFANWHKENNRVKLGTFAEAALFSELIFNATQGANSINALNLSGKENLKGKILIDIGNPLDFSQGMPPCLIPSLSNTNSLGEEIQKTFPDTKVVKTLNTMWCGLMVNPALINNADHTNFICGNDAEAKNTVKSLLNEFGWKNENLLDLGDISCARGTEAILPVWLRIWGATKNGAFNFKIVS
ncbi:MAG: NAD(P)-binding domain-containing protein [Bacteroidetes bacterium]|nr:NAD(P)-binding domain-containing protein [Bacteroidota bacterium]